MNNCTINPVCGNLTGTWSSSIGLTWSVLEEQGGALRTLTNIGGSNFIPFGLATGTRVGVTVTLSVVGSPGYWSACDRIDFPQFPLTLTRVNRTACGDGSVGIGEGCDDGNLVNGDGCNAYRCFIPAGNPVPGFTGCGICVSVLPTCGNATVDSGEGCDDGNLVQGDGCESNCTLTCGNGILDPGEECDDGNVAEGDCCTSSCQFEPSGTQCRAALAGLCDVAESCTGSSGQCPADALDPLARRVGRRRDPATSPSFATGRLLSARWTPFSRWGSYAARVTTSVGPLASVPARVPPVRAMLLSHPGRRARKMGSCARVTSVTGAGRASILRATRERSVGQSAAPAIRRRHVTG